MTGRAIGPANGARRRVGPWAVLTRHALASLRLPAADGRIRARLEARLVALISSIRSAATRFRHAGSWTLGAVLRQDGQLDRAADRLSQVLGLPPG